MEKDPTEDEVDNLIVKWSTEDDIDNIIVVEPTGEWTQFGLDMARVANEPSCSRLGSKKARLLSKPTELKLDFQAWENNRAELEPHTIRPVKASEKLGGVPYNTVAI